MKKAILSMMVLAALTATKTNAQVKDNLSLGPIVGFGHSWNSYDYGTGVEKKFNPSLNIGGRLVYSAAPKIGLGLDATFRTEGVKTESGSLKSTSHANYIRLDPKLYYFFGKYGQAFRPKIGVGPSFGFLVGGRTRYENPSGGAALPETDTKDSYKNFDFGVAGSVGFNYRLKSKTWLNVDAGYNHGLVDITKTNTSSPQNRSLFLNVGVTFGIGHTAVK